MSLRFYSGLNTLPHSTFFFFFNEPAPPDIYPLPPPDPLPIYPRTAAERARKTGLVRGGGGRRKGGGAPPPPTRFSRGGGPPLEGFRPNAHRLRHRHGSLRR